MRTKRLWRQPTRKEGVAWPSPPHVTAHLRHPELAMANIRQLRDPFAHHVLRWVSKANPDPLPCIGLLRPFAPGIDGDPIAHRRGCQCRRVDAFRHSHPKKDCRPAGAKTRRRHRSFRSLHRSDCRACLPASRSAASDDRRKSPADIPPLPSAPAHRCPHRFSAGGCGTGAPMAPRYTQAGSQARCSSRTTRYGRPYPDRRAPRATAAAPPDQTRSA